MQLYFENFCTNLFSRKKFNLNTDISRKSPLKYYAFHRLWLSSDHGCHILLNCRYNYSVLKLVRWPVGWHEHTSVDGTWVCAWVGSTQSWSVNSCKHLWPHSWFLVIFLVWQWLTIQDITPQVQFIE